MSSMRAAAETTRRETAPGVVTQEPPQPQTQREHADAYILRHINQQQHLSTDLHTIFSAHEHLPLVLVTMPNQQQNREKIEKDCRGTTFLGAYISDRESIPPLQWYSRPWAIAEIYRWMAHVSFSNEFQREDCEELFGLFNIRRGTKDYLSDGNTLKLQGRMLNFIKTDLLPALRTNGIVRGGIWDPRTKLVWAQDDWDWQDISLDNLEKVFPSRHQIVPETKYSDVVANEKQSKAEYETVKQSLDSMVERHSQLFAEFREKALEMDGDEDELLAQLTAKHEQLVSEHLQTTKLMLQKYRMWQLYKTKCRIWKKKLSG